MEQVLSPSVKLHGVFMLLQELQEHVVVLSVSPLAIPVGGAGGAAATYAIAKHNIMSVEDDHDENQWFKYKCPNCGCN